MCTRARQPMKDLYTGARQLPIEDLRVGFRHLPLQDHCVKVGQLPMDGSHSLKLDNSRCIYIVKTRRLQLELWMNESSWN